LIGERDRVLAGVDAPPLVAETLALGITVC